MAISCIAALRFIAKNPTLVPPIAICVVKEVARAVLRQDACYLYKVRPGDTILAIAARYKGVKSADQMKAVRLLIGFLNPDIKDLSRIYAGQKINLPTQAAVDMLLKALAVAERLGYVK